jgi:opacity protein-like surface antigen
MKNFYCVFPSAVLGFCLSAFSISNAVASTSNMYFGLHSGYSLPGKFSDDSKVVDGIQYGNLKPKGSPIFGAFLGYKISEQFRADVSLSHRGYNFDRSFEVVNGANKEKANVKQKMNSLALMLNGYYDFSDIQGFTPYVTAGIGLSRNNAKDYAAELKAGEELLFAQGAKGKNSTSFAWSIGAGVTKKVAANVSISLGYNFIDLGKMSTENIIHVSPAFKEIKAEGKDTVYEPQKAVEDDLKYPLSPRLRAHEILVSLRYDF